jgi:hypothetical protein
MSEDLDAFRLAPGALDGWPKAHGKPRRGQPRRRVEGEYLRGPIPLAWLSRAAGFRGKAPLAVALAVWFEHGRRKQTEVKLSWAILRRFGLDRQAGYRGLAELESAGLVAVDRAPGKNPVVRILSADAGGGECG